MLIVIPVSPLEGVQLDNIPSDFPLHHDPHTATPDTALHGLGSALSNAASAVPGGGDKVAHAEEFINTPLQLGQTLVVYHPHSQQPPEVVDTANLMFPCEPQPSLPHQETQLCCVGLHSPTIALHGPTQQSCVS